MPKVLKKNIKDSNIVQIKKKVKSAAIGSRRTKTGLIASKTAPASNKPAVKKTTKPKEAAQNKVAAKKPAIKKVTSSKADAPVRKKAVKKTTAKKNIKKKIPVLKGTVVTLTKSVYLQDSDNDGLTDWEEINVFGSDPYSPDSDGDGVSDGQALLQGKNPATGKKMKNLFIPHAGNDYNPHALHPRRLMFHAVSALAVKAVVVLFVVAYPLLAWMTPDVAAGEGQKIIALTNGLRSSLSLPALQENHELDAAAAKKVEDMFINQYFAHISPRGLDLEHFLALAGYQDYTVVGENLAMGYTSAEEAMAAWKKSPTHYANLIDENYTEIGVGLAGGRYAGADTVFIAQYFGLSGQIEAAADSDDTGTKAAVLSQKIETTPSTPIPMLTREQATIDISTSASRPNEKVIKVAALLPSETAQAVAAVDGVNIVLAPTVGTQGGYAQIAEPSEILWAGQIAINDNGYESASIVPPTVIATDNAGNTAKIMVSPDSVKPQVSSFFSRYTLFKSNPDSGLAKVFDATTNYFYILLGLVMIVLSLNIFINIKKQRPKLIVSSLGLIALLIMLIVF